MEYITKWESGIKKRLQYFIARRASSGANPNNEISDGRTLKRHQKSMTERVEVETKNKSQVTVTFFACSERRHRKAEREKRREASSSDRYVYGGCFEVDNTGTGDHSYREHTDDQLKQTKHRGVHILKSNQHGKHSYSTSQVSVWLSAKH